MMDRLPAHGRAHVEGSARIARRTMLVTSVRVRTPRAVAHGRTPIRETGRDRERRRRADCGITEVARRRRC